MFKHKIIKRSLVSGLVIAATSFPPAAQAMYVGSGGSGGPSAPVLATVTASPHSSFQWGDAGIGAAAGAALLGAGVLGAGATRRRRRVVVS